MPVSAKGRPAAVLTPPVAARQVWYPDGRLGVFIEKAALPHVTRKAFRRQLRAAGVPRAKLPIFIEAFLPFLADAPQPSSALH